ncbi:SusC/RagA family TonB-linked outer membrane protein [Compostibacter hankyongensis]|uniref:TonB-dependent receptor n=1 Tax=Compostibacter hankyongensis TaxID=1007089 RepID=A0ABP8FJI3_9BACT
MYLRPSFKSRPFLLAVKLTAALLLTGFLSTSAKGLAQTITLSGKNMPLQKVLSLIEQQTDYAFFYNNAMMTGSSPVTITLKDASLKDALDKVFANQPLSYTIQGETIFIREAAHENAPPVVKADIEVQGTVVDSITHKPLSGVTIRVAGTTSGTATDADGKFSLSVSGNATLEVSYLGYRQKTVAINGKTTLTIALASSATGLDQVVVVGYGTLDKKEVTSAITHLSSKELLSVGGNNALMSMQGKVAGLSVANKADADPNSSPSIQLRGVSSRNAGLGPLYVIDGVAGGNIDNINQNDIQSIDVLKGGAASAIYGTRGSNGVIVITTKKGTSGYSMTYNGYTSFDLPTNQLEVLSPEEFLAHDRGLDYGHKTNWLDAITRDAAFSQKHTLQFSGGNEHSNYFASLDYRNSQGMDLRAGKQEYGGRLNLTHNAPSKLYTISLNIAPRFIKSNDADYGAYSQALTVNPTMPVRDTVNPLRYFNVHTGFTGAFNPVEDINTILSGSEGKYLDMSGTFKLNIMDNLNTQVTLGESIQDWFDFDFTPSTNTTVINNNGGRNTAGRKYYKNDLKSFEWTGNYFFDVKGHSFKALAGYSYSYYNASGMEGSNQELPSDRLTYNNLDAGLWNREEGQNNISSYKNDSRLIAFFGRINYDYKGKYFLSASLRHEGSSKFGTEHKWGNFPAASVGWMISEESFMQGVPWISSLKLRGDYGETGNQNFDNYLSLYTYSGAGYYLYNGTYYQVWGPGQNPNEDLHWEKAVNFNVGLDFSLLDNRIGGSLNYYIRTNKDLLGSYNVPFPPNVQGSIYTNVGTMKNSGIELQLSAPLVQTKNFTYTLSFTGATNDNNFISFSNKKYHGQDYLDVVGMPAPGSPGTAQRIKEGRRIGSFYMLHAAGVDSSGALLVYNKDDKIIPANQATADDKRFVGNGLPKFTASLGNDFTYRQWDLSIFLRGAFGYDLYNTTAFYLGTPATQSGANVLTSAYGDSKYARLSNPATTSSLSDYFLEPGDFVKIDNVSLGYTFKSRIKYFSSARVYATARNLKTFTKWTGGDPDYVSINGLYPGINTNTDNSGTLSYYPSTIQLLVGLQVNF